MTGTERADDALLVVAVERHDQEALAELYRRHGGSLFHIALRVLAVRGLTEESSRTYSPGCGRVPSASTRPEAPFARSYWPRPTAGPRFIAHLQRKHPSVMTDTPGGT